MPQVTIYLDHELAERLRASDIKVSHVCQKALRREVDKGERCEQVQTGSTETE